MQHQPSDLSETHLQKGPLRLSICPALGGAITRLTFDGIDLLRPWDGSDSVRRTGCFVLAPFSNRVGNGGFEFEGERYSLRNLSPDHALPIHGVAWKRSWMLTAQSETELTLRLTHQPEGEGRSDWPFAFELEHELRLNEQGVELSLNLRNTDTRSMPAGLGWHPYFARHDDCVLQFAAQSVWLNDERNLPAELVSVPAQWDFRQPERLAEPGLDNCFVGWDGRAWIHWPEKGIALTMTSALQHLVVFTPPAEMGFFAVEPVSHANNALGMHDPMTNGIRILAPGEAMTANCRISIERTTRPGP
ncbi:aldose 1-epimerase [Pseudomonas stutzeri]|uniref:aldose 1-epimerase n=1 Tax=Stutzerimonas stutzeri TaxID=316 RepID=UPI00210A2FEA|nr:aldose 1-epimerase [Stutzerimonas stutzeri]MCQ4310437.1 aldose 1-epimerase [Stutzerimonas stutzeri]